jgi:hypothetical protein
VIHLFKFHIYLTLQLITIPQNLHHHNLEKILLDIEEVIVGICQGMLTYCNVFSHYNIRAKVNKFLRESNYQIRAFRVQS